MRRRVALFCAPVLLCRGCGGFLSLPQNQWLRSASLQQFARAPPAARTYARVGDADVEPLEVDSSRDDDEEVFEPFERSTNVPGTKIDPRLVADTKLFSPESVKEGYRAGFITILGSPNVGKSTLMNQLIGDRLSIVTAKMQTTRHRIMGILTTEDFQAIFSDTPGVLLPAYRLQEGMMSAVRTALADADALLLLTDVFEEEFPDPDVLKRIELSEKPLVVAVNKVDLLPSDGRAGGLSARKFDEVRPLDETLALWQDRFPSATVLAVSALEGLNTERLITMLSSYLPKSPPLFADDVLSDRPVRFFAAEIIREQIFELFGQEIPYSCEVVVERFEDRSDRATITAAIVVNRDSQKGIVIGKGGSKIKEVGSAARVALEKFLDKRVRLDLTVRVDKDWRRNEASLRTFGYLS